MFAFGGWTSFVDDFNGWKELQVRLAFDTGESQAVDGSDEESQAGGGRHVGSELPSFG